MRGYVKKVVAVAAVAAVLAMVFAGCGKDDPVSPVENPHGFVGLELKPDGTALSYTVPASTDTDALKALAVQMYQQGQTNGKNAANMAVYCQCPSDFIIGSMHNYILLDITILKTQSEYFRIDYRIKQDIPMLDTAPLLNNIFPLVTTERRYTDTTMSDVRYQLVKNAELDADKVPYASWNKIATDTNQTAIPVYNSTQEGLFDVFNHCIDTDTISAVAITYNEEEGFYTVDLTLDVSNTKTTENTVAAIRDGSGDQNANYDDITISFELWDNGYFKSISTAESWSASVAMNIQFASTFSYEWSFSYDPADCQISTYADSAAMLEAIGG